MKGRIDVHGILNIQRASKMQQQICIYSKEFCRDSCPAFNEPTLDHSYVHLTLCKPIGLMIFDYDNFKDDRY